MPGYAIGTAEFGVGVRFLLTFGAVLLPRVLAAPRPFDLFFTATLGLQAWGHLIGLFGHSGNLFDRLEHFLSPRAHLYVSEADSVWDLVMDALGSLAGSLLPATWAGLGWGSRRRPAPRRGGAPPPSTCP